MTRGAREHSSTNVTHHLKGIGFPARKPDLEKQAKHNGADSDVLAASRAMPDEEYGSMANVMKGYVRER